MKTQLLLLLFAMTFCISCSDEDPIADTNTTQEEITSTNDSDILFDLSQSSNEEDTFIFNECNFGTNGQRVTNSLGTISNTYNHRVLATRLKNEENSLQLSLEFINLIEDGELDLATIMNIAEENLSNKNSSTFAFNVRFQKDGKTYNSTDLVFSTDGTSQSYVYEDGFDYTLQPITIHESTCNTFPTIKLTGSFSGWLRSYQGTTATDSIFTNVSNFEYLFADK